MLSYCRHRLPTRLQSAIGFLIDREKFKDDDFSVMSSDELLGTINSILSVLTLALGGIAAISLVVGGIGIMNIMLVSVTERTKEIGLRKAVGASPLDILTQFLIEAIMLSLLGGITGVILGAAGSWLLGKFIQTYVTWWSVVMSLLFMVKKFLIIYRQNIPSKKVMTCGIFL